MLTKMLEIDAELRIKLPELKEMAEGMDTLFRRRVAKEASPLMSTVVLKEEKVTKTVSVGLSPIE